VALNVAMTAIAGELVDEAVGRLTSARRPAIESVDPVGEVGRAAGR
jgi:hypothetical protein